MPKNIIKKEPKKTGEWFNPMKTLLIEKDVAETSITPFEKTTDPVSDLTVLPALEPSSEFTSRIRFDEITKAMEMTFSDVGQEHRPSSKHEYPPALHNKAQTDAHQSDAHGHKVFDHARVSIVFWRPWKARDGA